MSEPERLLRGQGPAAALLRAAAIDRPPAASRARLLAALAPGAPLPAAAAAGATVTLTRAALARWLVLSALGGGALSGGLVSLAHHAGGPRPAPAPSAAPALTAAAAPAASSAPAPAPATAPSAPPPSPPPAERPAAVAAVAPAPPAWRPGEPPSRPLIVDPDRVIQPGPAASAAAAASASPPASRAAPRTGLADEVAHLDRVRAALAAGEAVRALGLLDEHEVTFRGGLLGPEAHTLRINALEAAGRHHQAQAQIRSFLQRFPRSPHAARLEALLDPPRP